MLKAYDLCGPNPRPMTVDEVDALKYLVARLPYPQQIIIANIGADIGVSTLALLEAAPTASILSVDTGPCEGEFENIRKAGLDAGRVTRLLGRSQVIGRAWPGIVDMVFIDGDHSEAGVTGDIEAWHDRLLVHGIMAFHDYIPEPIPPEIKGRVVYAVDKSAILKDKYAEIKEARVGRVIAFRKLER